MRMFRGKMRAALIRSVRRNELCVPPRLTAARSVSLFNRLARSDWNVRIQETYTHGVSVAGYLARYLGGSPISGRRIEQHDRQTVVFRYRDHRDGRNKLLSLPTEEFIHRWLEHVPPKGLRTIRRSGLYANSCVEVREKIRQQLATTSDNAMRDASTQAGNVTPLEIECCPLCNTQVVTRIVVRPVRQPMIEKSPAFSLTRPP